MLLPLKPGNHVIIRDIKNKTAGDASIVSLGEGESFLVLFSEIRLSPGDKVELEVPQREDALYVFQTVVLEVSENGEYTLQRLGELQSLQRRKSQRIPVNRKAEYILLPGKKDEKDFHKALLLNISRAGALLAVKEPLKLRKKLFLIFEINLHTLPVERVVPTGIGGKVVREHFPLPESAGEYDYSYGVEFEKPFSALIS